MIRLNWVIESVTCLLYGAKQSHEDRRGQKRERERMSETNMKQHSELKL